MVGGGPSLTGFDFARLQGHCVGVNQSMFDLPCCAAGITLDNQFTKQKHGELCAFAARVPLYLALGNIWWRSTMTVPGAIYLQDFSAPVAWQDPGLSDRPDEICRGATSGYAALNLAVLKRTRRIVLLGYDYSVRPGHHHYHHEYFWHTTANDQSLGKWAKQFARAAADCRRLGIEVINASPESTIDVFPKMTIEEAFSWSNR